MARHMAGTSCQIIYLLHIKIWQQCFSFYDKSKAFNGIALPNNSSGLSKEPNLRGGVLLLYLDLSNLVLPEVLYGIWRYSDMHGMMLVWFAMVAGKQETMSHSGSHPRKSSLSLLFNLLELWRFRYVHLSQFNILVNFKKYITVMWKIHISIRRNDCLSL